MAESNWSGAVRALREGFLLTRPRTFRWDTAGRHFIDDMPVSAAVFDLAYAGQLTAARTVWLGEFDAQ
jgi:hypothetical protein